MNRTKIIEHYKKFMQLDKMQEDYQIDIDWMQAFIEDNNLVNKNDLFPVVSGSCSFNADSVYKDINASYNTECNEMLLNVTPKEYKYCPFCGKKINYR